MARDLYSEITNRIVFDLERGVAPWEKPWKSANGAGGAAAGMPMNATTGKAYRGINILLLWAASARRGWNDLRFLTFKQALDAGGAVRKGEHGEKIYFYKSLNVKDRNSDDDEATKTIPMLREFTVFHVSQVDGCEALAGHNGAPTDLPADTSEFCEALGATVVHGGNRACYSSAADRIAMPMLQDFKSADDYRATLYHELTHWTGHCDRLNRRLRNRFGSEEYAREELVAELGGAFLCGEFGLTYQTQHASYLASWLEVLKSDSRAILQAASAAQKSVDFMRAKIIGTSTETPAEAA